VDSDQADGEQHNSKNEQKSPDEEYLQDNQDSRESEDHVAMNLWDSDSE